MKDGQAMLERKHRALLEIAARRGLPSAGGIGLCFQLLSLAAAIDRDCAARLAPRGLSEGKFVLLFLLHEQAQGLAPHELAAGAGVTRATVTGLLDGLSADGQVTLQSATEGGASSASAPMSGPGQVALDRETGEEICYFRATLTDVPARASYSLLAGETVLGQYAYDELTETGSILVIVEGD